MSLQYGDSEHDIVTDPLFQGLQIVQSNLRFEPEKTTINVSQHNFTRDEVLLMVDVLGEFEPSKVFPAQHDNPVAFVQAHRSILLFAFYTSDLDLMKRLAEKFFGFFNPETRESILGLLYNWKESDEDSALFLSILFRVQGAIASNLSSKEQGVFLETFSGLMTADVEIFKKFSLSSVLCIDIHSDTSIWHIEGSKVVLGNSFNSTDWDIEFIEGNRHLEIAFLLNRLNNTHRDSFPVKFLRSLESIRYGFKTGRNPERLASNVIDFAVDRNMLKFIVDIFGLFESNNISLFPIAVNMLRKGLEKNNLEITLFALEKINNEPMANNFHKYYFDPISTAIENNSNIEVFEALFLSADTMGTRSRVDTSHLQQAIERKRGDIALSLLKKGANPNGASNGHVGPPKTILKLAIEQQLVEVVRELLQRGATVCQSCFFACKGNTEILNLLFEYEENISPLTVDYLLQGATQRRNLDEVLFLESKGLKFSLRGYLPDRLPLGGLSIEPSLFDFFKDYVNLKIFYHLMKQEESLTDEIVDTIWFIIFIAEESDLDTCFEVIEHLRSRNEEYFPRNSIMSSLPQISSPMLEWLLNTFEEKLLSLFPLHSLLLLDRGQEVQKVLKKRPELIYSRDLAGNTLLSIDTQIDWLFDAEFDSS